MKQLPQLVIFEIFQAVIKLNLMMIIQLNQKIADSEG